MLIYYNGYVVKKDIHLSLTDRQKSILKAVIEHYQEVGQPVSSKWLTEEGGFSESSATLRAELSNLEALGYLDHLHTSGARFPTDYGYRFYIDDCLKEHHLADPILHSFVRSIYAQYTGDPFEFSRALGIFVSKRLMMPVVASVDHGMYCWKGGLSFLANYQEMLGKDQLLPIVSFIDQFEYMFAPFIDKMTIDRDVSVMIGDENQIFGLSLVSILVGNFLLPGNRRGKLLIVAPSRAEYQKILPYMQNLIHELNNL